jgi:hypothetical protein
MDKLPKKRGGMMTIQIIIFSSVAIVLMSGFILWTNSFLNFSLRNYHKSLAFDIAESGIDYYRWHLAHNKTDYRDGVTSTGPYTHNYYDKDGDLIGQFTLEITPPLSGSTVVTIKSTGKVTADPTIQKVIRVKMGIPSFAKYAFATANDMRFGAGTEVYGEIISNAGIRFDGVAHNIVKSARTTTTDPDSPYDLAWGVHTHTAPADQSPPAVMANRPDVFLAGRQVGVPAIDFGGITQDLAGIRTMATTSGIYVPTSTTGLGYELVLNTTSSYVIYNVTVLATTSANCTNDAHQSRWGAWSVQSRSFRQSGPIPANGIFFFAEDVWVRGKINNSRVTVATGRFPNNSTTTPAITINSDLTYTNYDGRDVIQLISQTNLNVGMLSNDVLRIDAALISQVGRVGRYYYNSHCTSYTRSQLTSYGMIGSGLRYGFAYTDGTGYATRNLIYDSNLLYGPPPAAPETGDQYVQISWEELQ